MRPKPLWTLIGLAVLVCLVAIEVAWHYRRPPTNAVLALAERIEGERFYRLEFRDEAIGTFTTRTRVGRHGVMLASHLRAQMPGAQSHDVEERLEFSTQPPFALTLALRRTSKDGETHDVRIEPAGYGYRAELTHAHSVEFVDLPWTYDLSEHLSLEAWLAHVKPARGADLTVRVLDFDRLMPKATRYAIAEARADGGYLVKSASRLEDKLMDIGPDLVPNALAVASAFLLVRTEVEPAQAFQFRTRTHSPTARVALRARIADPRRVRRLVLSTDTNTAEVLQSPGIEVHDAGGGPMLIVDTRVTQPTNEEELDAALGPTLDLPVTSPEIGRLAERVPVEQQPTEQVRALLRFVGNQLTYDELARNTHLSGALQSGRGDCTEFADLFTTLARALGIPARGVEGLVYGEVAGPGFYLHAWSEVAMDGRWVAVDPTTGQDRIDATHLPFPATSTGFLRAYAALPKLRLEVRSVDY